MKRRIVILCLYLLGFALAQLPRLASGQPTNPWPPTWWTNPPPILWTNFPPDWTNNPPVFTNPPPVFTNLPPIWTNILHGLTNRSPWGTNIWWTNHITFTNHLPPIIRTNLHPPVIPPGGTGSPRLPKDVQTLLQQFQQQRNQLISSLDGASDAERQQVLQQLETLREQLQTQLAALREQMRDQLNGMRQQFGGHFAPGNASIDPGSSHGGRPRN